MTDYDPTVWNDDAPPAISAANLNKIEAGIDSAHSEMVEKSILTAIGDLLYASAVGVASRLGIGTNGKVLTVVSGVPAWADPSSGAIEKIFDYEVTGAAATTIDSNTILGGDIPQTFAHLWLVAHVKSSGAASAAEARLRVNNDSAANYDYENNGGSGIATTQIGIGQMPGSGGVTDAWSTIDLKILDYRSAKHKLTEASGVEIQGGNPLTAAGIARMTSLGRWRSTSAITRLALFASSDGYAIGSRVTLYGLKV